MLQVNEYFEGKVKSIGFQGDPLAASVGVMSPGEFEFGTSQRETMSVVSGKLLVMLPDSDMFVTFTAGMSFVVEAGSSFKVQTSVDSAYLCTYE